MLISGMYSVFEQVIMSYICTCYSNVLELALVCFHANVLKYSLFVYCIAHRLVGLSRIKLAIYFIILSM